MQKNFKLNRPKIEKKVKPEEFQEVPKIADIHQNPWFIMLVTFIFFPVGLFLFYRYGKYSKTTKIFGIIAFLMLMGMGLYLATKPNP